MRGGFGEMRDEMRQGPGQVPPPPPSSAPDNPPGPRPGLGVPRAAAPAVPAPALALCVERPPVLAELVADLADGAAGAQRLAHRREQVLARSPATRRTSASAASAPAASRSARTRAVRSSWRCSAAGSRRCSSIVLALRLLEAVDADDHALAGLDLRRVAVGRVLDLALDEALLDRRDRAAELVDPVDQLERRAPRARRSAPR